MFHYCFMGSLSNISFVGPEGIPGFTKADDSLIHKCDGVFVANKPPKGSKLTGQILVNSSFLQGSYAFYPFDIKDEDIFSRNVNDILKSEKCYLLWAKYDPTFFKGRSRISGDLYVLES